MPNEARCTLSVFDEVLCAALAVGLVLVAIVPAARGMSVVGWLPMWLVGMPAVAWWALHGFALPWRLTSSGRGHARPAAGRRGGTQAQRATRAVRRRTLRHAA